MNALRPAQRDLVTHLGREIREAATRAQEASVAWREQSTILRRFLDDSRIADPIVRQRIYSNNLELNACMDTWSWWEREQKRLESLLHAEYLVLVMLSWGDPGTGADTPQPVFG